MDKLKNLYPSIIAFDGPDGSGKTTLIAAFQDVLDKSGVRSTVISLIPESPERTLLINEANYTKRERLLLVALCYSRAVKMIQEALLQPQIILLDRSPLSIDVYQRAIDGLSKEIDGVFRAVDPVQTIANLVYCNIEDDLAEERIAARGIIDECSNPEGADLQYDAFESKGYVYRQKVRDAYRVAIEKFSTAQEAYKIMGCPYTKIHAVDGALAPELNATMILYEINDSL